MRLPAISVIFCPLVLGEVPKGDLIASPLESSDPKPSVVDRAAATLTKYSTPATFVAGVLCQIATEEKLISRQNGRLFSHTYAVLCPLYNSLQMFNSYKLISREGARGLLKDIVYRISLKVGSRRNQ